MGLLFVIQLLSVIGHLSALEVGVLTHRNLTSNLDSASQFIPGRSSDRLLSILPLSHMFEQMGGLLMAL